MQDAANTKDTILDAAVRAVATAGLTGCTVAGVAELAAVSSALVHYHFDTKSRLVLAAAERLADRRVAGLRAALTTGSGLHTVDALWRVIEARAASGDESAWSEMRSLAHRDEAVAAVTARARTAERTALAARLEGLLAELGVRPPTGTDELADAVLAALEGASVSLAAGEAPAAVRAAYDALWLVLVAAGTGARRR